MSYPYFRMYPGDYRRDTSHLTLAEHGAYALLLCQYYATGKPLPADQQSLCRICSAQTPEEVAAVRTVADAFFAPNGDGLRHNKRADRELSDLAELSATNVERARKAAVRSWEVRRGSSPSDAPSNAPSSATSSRQAMLEQCQPEPAPEPNPASEATAKGVQGGNEPPRQAPAPKPKTFKQWTATDLAASVAEANADAMLTTAEVADFVSYWTEPTATGRLKVATMPTWDTRRRMQTAVRMVYSKQRAEAKGGGNKYRSQLPNVWIDPNPDPEKHNAF